MDIQGTQHVLINRTSCGRNGQAWSPGWTKSRGHL